jgi:hypothetical protein
MNQVLRNGAREERKTTMLNAETNDTAATVAEQGASVAPEKTTPKKATGKKKGAPKSLKTDKAAKPSKGAAKEKKPAKRKNTPRSQGKGAKILEMIGRAKGATLAEIMSVCGWQAHSVRGFISTASKKHGVRIESLKNDAGDRVYRAAK